jgi:hypothetical protein
MKLVFISQKMNKRQPNFSKSEIDALTDAVERRSKVLFGRLGGVMSIVSKDGAWSEVAMEVSAVSGVKRSTGEVKKKWIMMKSAAKGKAVELNRERVKTGGGQNKVGELSECESRIVSVMGEVCVKGVSGGFDLNEALLNGFTEGKRIFFLY